MARSSFGWDDFAWRWALAIVVVLGTYNPTGYSFVDWAMDPEGRLPVKVLTGIIIAILYVILIRATWNSIGPIGLGLVGALLGTTVWVAVDFEWLSLDSGTAFSWVVLVIIATILGVGLSWSHVRRRLSGQIDTDDVED